METGGQIPNQGNARVVKMDEDKTFDFFFRKYFTALCHFANSIIHDEDEAKDIVQDSYVKLWNGQTMNERSETVQSFLYTTVRNKCLDILRKRKVISKAKAQLIRQDPLHFEYFDEAAFSEMMRQVIDCIEELPERSQHIIKLYYIDGKKHLEIAGEINSTAEAVRKQKTRALNAIRKKLLFLLSFFFTL